MTDDPILRAQAQKRADIQASRISNRLKHIANHIEKELGKILLPGEEKPLFSLFVFTAGAAQYVGNCDRDEMRQIVATVLKRWDDQEHAGLHKPFHEKTEDELNAERKTPL